MSIQKTTLAIILGVTLSTSLQAGITVKGSDGGIEHLTKDLLALQTKATLLGFAKNEYELGMAYYDGKLTPRNASKAVEWLAKASKKTYAPAMFVLGQMLIAGDGLQQNVQLGNQLILAAANKGNASALAFIENTNKMNSSVAVTQTNLQNTAATNGMCSYQDFYIPSAGDIEYAQQNGTPVTQYETYIKGACTINITYSQNNLVKINANLRANGEDYPAYIVTKLNNECDEETCGMSISTEKHQLMPYDSIRRYDHKGNDLDQEQYDNYLNEKIKQNQSYCFQNFFAHSGSVFCLNLGGYSVYQHEKNL